MGSKRLRGKGDAPQASGNAYGKAGELRESIACARRSEAQKLTMTGIHTVRIHGHTTGRRHVQKSEVGLFWERPKHAPSPQSHGFWSQACITNCCQSRSASGSQCGEIVTLTWDAESADFGGKGPRVGRKSPSLESGHGTHVLEAGWKPSSPGLAVTGWQRHSGRRLGRSESLRDQVVSKSVAVMGDCTESSSDLGRHAG